MYKASARQLLTFAPNASFLEPSMTAQQMIQEEQHPALSSSSSLGDPGETATLRRFFFGSSSACGAYARMERCTMVDAEVSEGILAGNDSSTAHTISMQRRREAQSANETHCQASPRPAGSSRDTICANTTAQAVVRPANLHRYLKRSAFNATSRMLGGIAAFPTQLYWRARRVSARCPPCGSET